MTPAQNAAFQARVGRYARDPAHWVDQNLILSMHPHVNVFLQIFANPGEHDAKHMLLNMITTSVYLEARCFGRE